jgi:hypothetical protein
MLDLLLNTPHALLAYMAFILLIYLPVRRVMGKFTFITLLLLTLAIDYLILSTWY